MFAVKISLQLNNEFPVRFNLYRGGGGGGGIGGFKN